MKEYQHILLNKDWVKTNEYKAQAGRSKKAPDKSRKEQYDFLSDSYRDVLAAIHAKYAELENQNIKVANGTYIDFDLYADSVNLDSFDTKNGGVLMNIQNTANNGGILKSTLFIPNDNASWLPKKLEDYSNPEKDRKNENTGEVSPRNQRMINSIIAIKSSSLSSFFTLEDSNSVESIPENIVQPYEFWVEKKGLENNAFFTVLDRLGIRYNNNSLCFKNISVFLVFATKEQLEKAVLCVDYLSEIRYYKQPSILTNIESVKEENNWCDIIKNDVVQTNEFSARIGILDSGVNNGHPLLCDYLPQERCKTVINSPVRDRSNHGTGMAGLALYGDLTDVIYSRKPCIVNHDLASVKMMPANDEKPNDPDLYGVITEDAIDNANKLGANIMCMAITAESILDGDASSWSSALDRAIYKDGINSELMFVSAGNIYSTDGVAYPNFNINNPIGDPAQAWNAITVGAYTEKCLISDPTYSEKQVLASKGGLSPYSRTSVLWDKKCIKPEIVMEGGNAYDESGDLITHNDLTLVTTSSTIDYHKFNRFYATSAATALASNLAAKIKTENPTLSNESIRALMIHSSEWTQGMVECAKTEDDKVSLDVLMHSCGYGTPVERKALKCNDNYVVFIVENEIFPLEEGKNKNVKFANMHYYDLPWPKDILLDLGEKDVRMKITLSYYIDPAPGRRAWKNKHLYQSLGLRFDVNTDLENKDAFLKRVSRLQQEEEEGNFSSRNDTQRWQIGIQRRNQGCIHSDWIKGTAASLANCNMVAIYPVGGWWKYNKEKVKCSIKYSLVVSLETPDMEIYSEIKQLVDIATAISVS